MLYKFFKRNLLIIIAYLSFSQGSMSYYGVGTWGGADANERIGILRPPINNYAERQSFKFE